MSMLLFLIAGRWIKIIIEKESSSHNLLWVEREAGKNIGVIKQTGNILWIGRKIEKGTVDDNM